MTESIKFGPEWLRNSVANVAPSQQQQQQQMPQSPSSDSIISRPVLSDHRYGREEMLSLCDKSARLPDALPRFRRLFVADWQMPLALQPITDDEQIGSRGLGGTGAPTWGGTHIRPLMPSMGRGSGIIRGGAIERGRGRGRGLYHGTSYTRSTSLYDEEGRRWLDRNGTEPTAEWSAGSSVSPRKEGFSRNALESWRKGTRDENEEGWRSSSNGTNAAGPTARDKWTRSTSWRDGTTDNGLSNDLDRSNGTSQGISSSPTGGVLPNNEVNPNSIKVPIAYKKSWDEDHNLPEWATESFDYGGTFDASGAFHDSERGGGVNVNMGNERNNVMANDKEHKNRNDQKKETLDNRKEMIENNEPSPAKFINFLNENTLPQQEKTVTNEIVNGPSKHPAPIAQMDKMVENFVANLIMDDDNSTMNTVNKVPPSIEWFYRDPQGDTQGPFLSGDMSEWYKAGYFQESLMVRRSIDSNFTPLGHLVKIFGAARPFIAACIDGGPPIPLPEVMDPFRMRMMPPQAPIAPVPPVQPDNWSLMTAEQRMFFMQLASHQPRPPVDPYVMKAPQPPSNPLDIRRLMGGDFFQSSQQQVPQHPPPQVPTQQPQPQQSEPDPIHQLIMQLQMQQKTGGVDAAQWIKPSQQPVQQSEMPPQMIQQKPPPPLQQQNSSSAHWSGTPMNIWDLGNGNKEQHHQQSMHDVQMTHQQHQQQPPEPDIIQNGNADDLQHQMQKVESKKKKKEVKDQQSPQVAKEQPKEKKPPQQVEKKKQEKKKEERTTQPAAPAPWVGHQNSLPGQSLTKIQKTEAQRRQIELAAQKEREQKQLELMVKQDREVRDVKWNMQMPPAASIKTLDEIQAEEQTAAVREERAQAKREKKEVVIVGDIWNTGAHSMAWQQPKTWSGAQSNSGFWEDPVKQPVQPKQPPQMLSKSQTMATISTAKRQVQQQQQAQQQAQAVIVQQKKQETTIIKKRIEKKKDDNNNEFTIWCTRTLSAMNGNVDVPTFVSFLQDLESPFEVKDYIKMYLGETKDCTEFAKQFLERRSKQRMQQRQQNAHIDDMCSPAPAINPQANSGGDFQEVKVGKNKKAKPRKVMRTVDNRILGFTATSAEGRINVGDRDYGDV